MKRSLLVFALVVLCMSVITALDADSYVGIRTTPGVTIPVGESADLLRLSGGGGSRIRSGRVSEDVPRSRANAAAVYLSFLSHSPVVVPPKKKNVLRS
jgi:hypothetical protein